VHAFPPSFPTLGSSEERYPHYKPFIAMKTLSFSGIFVFFGEKFFGKKRIFRNTHVVGKIKHEQKRQYADGQKRKEESEQECFERFHGANLLWLQLLLPLYDRRAEKTLGFHKFYLMKDRQQGGHEQGADDLHRFGALLSEGGYCGEMLAKAICGTRPS
jgi:hypothetical protein